MPKRETFRLMAMTTYEIEATDMIVAQVALLWMAHGCQKTMAQTVKTPQGGNTVTCKSVEYQEVHIDSYKRRLAEAEKEARQAIDALSVMVSTAQSVIDERIETKGELDWGANELRMALNKVLRKEELCPPSTPSAKQD